MNSISFILIQIFFGYKELLPNGDRFRKRIFLPLLLLFVRLHVSHAHELTGHLGQIKALANLKRFFFAPKMFEWNTVLINDCLSCQKNEQKREDLYEAPLHSWGGLKAFPFRTAKNDHKGPPHPLSSDFDNCLVVVDHFFRFIPV